MRVPPEVMKGIQIAATTDEARAWCAQMARSGEAIWIETGSNIEASPECVGKTRYMGDGAAHRHLLAQLEESLHRQVENQQRDIAALQHRIAKDGTKIAGLQEDLQAKAVEPKQPIRGSATPRCSYCFEEFSTTPGRVRRSLGSKLGIHCSRKCAAKHQHQLGIGMGKPKVRGVRKPPGSYKKVDVNVAALIGAAIFDDD